MINKGGKLLFSNFGYLMILQITSYIFPLITIPYLANVLGLDGFGKIAFAAAVIVWFQTITDWGFNYTATRDLARNREDSKQVSEIFSNVLWARLFLSLVSLLLLLGLIASIPYFNDNRLILVITFLSVPSQVFFPEWFFQAMERMKYITIFSLLSRALFTALVFIFIKDETDFILQPLFISLGYVVSGVFAMYLIVIKWKVKIHSPRPLIVLDTIKKSTDVFINNMLPNLYNSFSIVLVGFLSGSAANGLFDAGSKFLNISNQFMSVLSRVFFPFLSRRLDKHTVYSVLNLFLAFFVSVVLFFAAPLLIETFFTPEFYQATLVLQIMSFSIFFLSLTNVYGINYLIIEGYERELRNITFFVSLFGCVLSLSLIYMYGYIGAAITLTVTRALLGLTVMYKARKIKKCKLKFRAI